MRDPMPMGRTNVLAHTSLSDFRSPLGHIYLPGASIKGSIRAAFRTRYSSERCLDGKLFGGCNEQGDAFPGQFIVSDLKLDNEQDVAVVSSADGTQQLLSAGAVFSGRVAFREELSGHDTNTLLSGLLSVEAQGLGRKDERRGLLGRCRVEITGRKGLARVFISYSHESDQHDVWVDQLCERLISDQIDAVLDRRVFKELKEGRHVPEPLLNEYMNQGVKDADRILAVFTPTYKLKAEDPARGVYKEQVLLMSELKADPRLKRYLGILRAGNPVASKPSLLVDVLTFDFRGPEWNELSYKWMISEILGNSGTAH
jgi:hypothetical protein